MPPLCPAGPRVRPAPRSTCVGAPIPAGERNTVARWPTRYCGSMRTVSAYWVPLALAGAGIALLAGLTRPDATGSAVAWWLPVGWAVAALVISALLGLVGTRPVRVFIGICCLPFCALLMTFGGLLFLPAVLALIGAAVIAPGRPWSLASRPQMPGPWDPHPRTTGRHS